MLEKYFLIIVEILQSKIFLNYNHFMYWISLILNIYLFHIHVCNLFFLTCVKIFFSSQIFLFIRKIFEFSAIFLSISL